MTQTTADPGELKQDAALHKNAAEASIPQLIYNFFSSYALSCIILLLLMVTTYFGTVAQKEMSLNQALAKYFHQLYFVEEVGPISLRLPGAYVLLVLLFVNLVLGGLLRMRWKWRNAGILITHIGMILLILAGFVKFYWSTNGAIQFWSGQVAQTYHAFSDYEVAIRTEDGDGRIKEYLVTEPELREGVVARHPELPFSLQAVEYLSHCVPQDSKQGVGIDGLVLKTMPPPGPDRRSFPGAVLELRPKDGKVQRGIVWSAEDHPWTVRVGDKAYTIGLRRQVFDMPFALRMEVFRREFHPHTRRPSHFSTDVTKIENGTESEHHITMNAPMRYGGLTFSQNNWGPQDDPDGPWFSVLEVSTNPADQWPKWCCYIIALGMSWHFLRKLRRDMERRRKMREAT